MAQNFAQLAQFVRNTQEALRYNKVYDKIFGFDLIPSIVTGGEKSRKVEENPFHFYYNEFQRQLINENNCCEELYVIGYSFRDNHINKAVKKRMSFERKRKNAIYLQKLIIVDFKPDQKSRDEFVDHINEALELGPNMSNRFKYDDPRIIFTGVDSIEYKED